MSPSHDDDLEEHEWPEPDTEEDGDAVDTVPCPFCGSQVYDNAEWCPHCRNYIFYEGHSGRKPLWLVGGVGICLLVVLYWIFH